MTYEEEKLARLKGQQSKRAIDLAMEGKWQEAVAANKDIIANFPRDVDAYNRLGRAYMELGDYPKARAAYQQTLTMDPYNPIARKNMQRLNLLGNTKVKVKGEARRVEPQQFIEEIGKAGVLTLYNLAAKQVRARMVAGDKVSLRVDRHTLIVENARREYLGQVDSRQGLRLIRLIEGGNKYSAAVVSSAEEELTVIIRETYQDPGQVGKLSFPPKGAEELKPVAGERLLKMEAGYEEETEEPGYTIVGGEGVEVMSDEAGGDEDMVNEEE